jgi:hypothetical protein
MTLVNAKDAGYLEALGDGNYRLNPVGYNLIAHVLGRGEEPRTKPAVKRKRKLRERSKTESRKKRKSAGKKPV